MANASPGLIFRSEVASRLTHAEIKLDLSEDLLAKITPKRTSYSDVVIPSPPESAEASLQAVTEALLLNFRTTKAHLHVNDMENLNVLQVAGFDKQTIEAHARSILKTRDLWDVLRLQTQHASDLSALRMIKEAAAWMREQADAGLAVKEPVVSCLLLQGSQPQRNLMPALLWLKRFASPYVLVEAVKAWSPWFLADWVESKDGKPSFLMNLFINPTHQDRMSQQSDHSYFYMRGSPIQGVGISVERRALARSAGHAPEFWAHEDGDIIVQLEPFTDGREDMLLGWCEFDNIKTSSLRYRWKSLLHSGLFHVLAMSIYGQAMQHAMPPVALAWLPKGWQETLNHGRVITLEGDPDDATFAQSKKDFEKLQTLLS